MKYKTASNYLVLMEFAKDCKITNDALAEKFHLDARTIQKHLKDMADNGLITRGYFPARHVTVTAKGKALLKGGE